MNPLPSYFPRPRQGAAQPPPRAGRIPADPQAARPGGGDAVAEVDRAPAVAPETMGRMIGVIRRLAGGEAVGEAMAAEARQILSLLGAALPPPVEAARARLNVVA